jgi:hypothetical protein
MAEVDLPHIVALPEVCGARYRPTSLIKLTMIACVVLQYYSYSSGSSSANKNATPKFKEFQANYLLVFMLAMFSGWLPGL